MSNTKDEQWSEMYELAKEYYEENGNLLVSRKHKTLYNWISNQRTN